MPKSYRASPPASVGIDARRFLSVLLSRSRSGCMSLLAAASALSVPALAQVVPTAPTTLPAQLTLPQAIAIALHAGAVPGFAGYVRTIIPAAVFFPGPVCRVAGMWRSLVAHLTGGQGVAGSNPVIPTLHVGQVSSRVIADLAFSYLWPNLHGP